MEPTLKYLPADLRFQEELRRAIEEFAKQGERGEAIVGVINVLQQELCMPGCLRGQEEEYRGSLEVLLRVMLAIMDPHRKKDGHISGDYVSDKLRFAIRCLARALEENEPSFYAAECRYETPLLSLK